MSFFEIYDYLKFTDGIAGTMQVAAGGFLAALATMTFCFASIRAAVFGTMSDPIAWGLRLLVVLGCLGAYNEITGAVIGASQELTGYFAAQADYTEYNRRVADQLPPMFEDPRVQKAGATADGEERQEPSEVDRLVGFLRGGMTWVVVSIACGLQVIVFDCITKLAVVILSLLKILGPAMIAAGILGDGRTMKQWFSSFIQVALWPAVPPLFMMIVLKGGGNAIESGNVVYAIHQALLLTLLAAGTPFVVSFIMGRGGVSAAVGAVTGFGFTAISNAANGVGAYRRWNERREESKDRRGVAARPGDARALERASNG